MSLSPTRGNVPATTSMTSPSKTERRATQLNQLNRKKSEMAALRISREKEKTGDSQVIEEEKADFSKMGGGDYEKVVDEESPVKLTVTRDSRSLLFIEEEDDKAQGDHKETAVRHHLCPLSVVSSLSVFW